MNYLEYKVNTKPIKQKAKKNLKIKKKEQMTHDLPSAKK